MTPLPKRRHSTRRGGKRKAAIKLGLPTATKCKNCGTVILPHSICPKCGYYQGREMIAIKVKTKKPKSK
jgi:large subunit ribosomal protein L32